MIVGVHTPEFAFEHVVGNMQRAVSEHGIRYPVAVDNDYGTWNAYANQYWPADYLIDRNGDLRDAHFGEGAYAETEADIRTLLGEKAAAPVTPAGRAHRLTARADARDLPGRCTARPATCQQLQEGQDALYHAPAAIGPGNVVLAGHWTVEQHQIVAGQGAQLLFRYTAPRIYLVAAPPKGATRTLRLTVDGQRQPSVRVTADDLYQLADMPHAGPHLLDLTVPAGTVLYSFTFG